MKKETHVIDWQGVLFRTWLIMPIQVMCLKLLLISDLHSNPYALEAIEKTESWDEVCCCGDFVDYGPFPMETIRWCIDHHARCVLGNHDAYVLGLSEISCTEAKREHRFRWAHDNYCQLTEEGLDFLRSLPRSLSFSADGIEYQVQHQYDQAYGTIESEEQFDAFWTGPQKKETERRLVFGHTHRQCVHMLNEHTLWLNPGSVSYRRPDDHDKRAHYMIVEQGKIRFGKVAYDRTPLLNRAEAYLKQGTMLETELQDAFFFFGNALTSREPLPESCTKLPKTEKGDHDCETC